MALTITKNKGNSEGQAGGIKLFVARIAFDNSYPTGGYAVQGSQFAMGTLVGLTLQHWNTAGMGYIAQFNAQTKKLMMFTVTPVGTIAAHSHVLNLKNAAVADGATTRVNAGTNLLGANTGGDLAIAGAGANGGIANTTAVFTGTAGALAEVLNTTDLSTLVGRFLALGY